MTTKKTADDWFREGLVHLDLSLGASITEYRTDLERALGAFEEALGLDRAHLGALRQRGFLLARLDQPEAALDSFISAASQQPGDVDLQLAVAGCHQRLHQLEGALRAYAEVLQHRPGEVAALLGRAQVLSSLGRNEVALQAWDSALAVLEAQQASQAQLDDVRRAREKLRAAQ